MRRYQAGLAAVEFALVGATALTVLIGCIEISRYFFVWNAIAEATRRGARVATVTSGTDTAKQAAVTQANYLDGLTTGNVSVTYYDGTGVATAVPKDIQFVTVAISGYTHTLLIPGVGITVAVPPFSTTLPVESLGFVPDS